MDSSYVLVLYYSRYGATEKMAQLLARGIEQAIVPFFLWRRSGCSTTLICKVNPLPTLPFYSQSCPGHLRAA